MPWRVFYSYSHRDADLRSELARYLTPLRRNGKIEEWYDRKIEVGTNWENEITAKLDYADLVLFLITENFLDSEYCFGVEVEKVLIQLKHNAVKVAPILLKDCLWKESRFSELQIIPRDGTAIDSRPKGEREKAFCEVAEEINSLVSVPPPSQFTSSEPESRPASLDFVRSQIAACVRAYEKIRQRIRPSGDRTKRMNQIFEHLRLLAVLSYPLFDEFSKSLSPGERLAAVAILDVFPREESLEFLVKRVSEKPFVSYHAIKALHSAVGALDPRFHLQLLEAIHQAKAALTSGVEGDIGDRHELLQKAEHELQCLASSDKFD
jgi:hypothetical protein